jgi:nitrous oxide reductase accessory protein NosL
MDNITRMRTTSLALLFCLTIFLGLARAEERKECSLCGMYLDEYASTVHVIIFKDGTRQETCSLACAAKIYAKEKARIKKIMAADFLNAAFVDAEHAVYLEGSDIPGVMSYTSRIAFRNWADAEKFQKKHGGKIVTFKDALQHQSEE